MLRDAIRQAGIYGDVVALGASVLRLTNGSMPKEGDGILQALFVEDSRIYR